MMKIKLFYQRGSTEALKRGTFEMWIEYVRSSWQFLNLVPRSRQILATPKLENCQLRRTCLIARGVNPTFHHQFVISHHQLTRLVSLNCLHFNIIATKIGRNGAVVGQVPHFGPFPLEKISKGVPKRVEYQVPPNPVFGIPNDSSS